MVQLRRLLPSPLPPVRYVPEYRAEGALKEAALETFSNPGRVKPPHCSTRMHERVRGLWFLKFNLMVSADR
jgi:hypothetical protein